MLIRLSPSDARRLGLVAPPAGRRKPGVMNRTERRYADQLVAQALLGEIRAWAFEPDVLLLGPEMTFRPDFRIDHIDGSIEYVDVKGRHVWEDSVIKAKAAAVLYPAFTFTQAKWNGKTWKVRRFKSGTPDHARQPRHPTDLA